MVIEYFYYYWTVRVINCLDNIVEMCRLLKNFKIPLKRLFLFVGNSVKWLHLQRKIFFPWQPFVLISIICFHLCSNSSFFSLALCINIYWTARNIENLISKILKTFKPFFSRPWLILNMMLHGIEKLFGVSNANVPQSCTNLALSYFNNW